jgi:hypothetical protein
MSRTDLFRDIVGVLGAGSIVAGVGLLNFPCSLILAGLMMLGGAWLSARS